MKRFALILIMLFFILLSAILINGISSITHTENQNLIKLNDKSVSNRALEKIELFANFSGIESTQEGCQTIIECVKELNVKLIGGFVATPTKNPVNECVLINDLQSGSPETKLNILFAFADTYTNADKEKMVKEMVSGSSASLLDTPPFSNYKQNINIGYYSKNLNFTCDDSTADQTARNAMSEIKNACPASDIILLFDGKTIVVQPGRLGGALNSYAIGPTPDNSLKEGQVRLNLMGNCFTPKWGVSTELNNELLWLIKHELGHSYGLLEHYPLLLKEDQVTPIVNNTSLEEQLPFVARISKTDLGKSYSEIIKNLMYSGNPTWGNDFYSESDYKVLEENLKTPLKSGGVLTPKTYPVVYVTVNSINDKLTKVITETTQRTDSMANSSQN